MKVSVVIPTYQREAVLIATLRLLLKQMQPGEILLMDQTPSHLPETESQLRSWDESGRLRWIQRQAPSITGAMNHGLSEATGDLVLFLDDDIEPLCDLVAVHGQAHAVDSELWATVGQVIQPWQKAETVMPRNRLHGLREDFDFPFHSTLDADVENVMAGNLCVNRERALSIGGFDENFTGTAYRFETEFSRRVIKAGGKIRFLGQAGIRHLRAREGGTRSEGSHLTSASPRHGFGDYYYAYLHGSRSEMWRYSGRRFSREICTKFHLTHPWWIPVKMLGELRAWRLGRLTASVKRRVSDAK